MTTPTDLTFVANTTPAISADWLNGVNDWVNGWYGAGTGVLGASSGTSFTAVTLRNALGSTGAGFGLVPSGGIIIWSGSAAAIPAGWLLCDGTSLTPDLRSRFVVGASASGGYAVGASGGSADSVVVSHTHTDSGHTHLLEATNNGVVGGTNNLGPGSGTNFMSTSSTNTGYAAISTTGVSGTNANLPPYYALCYIMKS